MEDGGYRQELLRAALHARLSTVTGMQPAQPVELPASVLPPDPEEMLRVLMVRTLPRAARGDRDALTEAIESVQGLRGVSDDPWFRFVDAWNHVFEVTLPHRAVIAGEAYEALLVGYEEVLRRTLERLG